MLKLKKNCTIPIDTENGITEFVVLDGFEYMFKDYLAMVPLNKLPNNEKDCLDSITFRCFEGTFEDPKFTEVTNNDVYNSIFRRFCLRLKFEKGTIVTLDDNNPESKFSVMDRFSMKKNFYVALLPLDTTTYAKEDQLSFVEIRRIEGPADNVSYAELAADEHNSAFQKLYMRTIELD